MTPTFCLDSGPFINSWRKHYPPPLFPCVWDCLGELCQENRIIIPKAVYDEIEVGGDDLFDWIKERKNIIHEVNEEVIRAVKEIMRDYGRLVDTKKGRSVADPWVIAHAVATSAVVVTEEEPAKQPSKSLKIPDVCNSLGIRYMNTVGLLRSRGFLSVRQASE